MGDFSCFFGQIMRRFWLFFGVIWLLIAAIAASRDTSEGFSRRRKERKEIQRAKPIFKSFAACHY